MKVILSCEDTLLTRAHLSSNHISLPQSPVHLWTQQELVNRLMDIEGLGKNCTLLMVDS